MEFSLSSSARSSGFLSILRDTRDIKSLSDASGSFSESYLSQTSSSDEVGHTDAIKRIRKESGGHKLKNNDVNSVTDSLKDTKIVDWTENELSKSALNLESERYADCFRQKATHYFILSQSGKPIFSRYGNDNQTAAFIGVMQAMVSFVANDGNDSLRVMRAGRHNFVFLVKPNIILVAVSCSGFTPLHLRIVLTYLYNLIISTLTFSTVQRLYTRQPSIDLRRLLVGTDRYLHGMLEYMEAGMGPIMNAVEVAPMQYTVRQALLSAISQAIKINIKYLMNDLVFAILLLDEKLVGVVRRRDQQPHPMDMQLLINLIRNSAYFKTQICWLPLCLPKFDPDGFLYAHISYLEHTGLSLVLLTVNPDQFDVLQQCRDTIFTAFEAQKLPQKLPSTYSVAELLCSNRLDEEVSNFIYKMRTANQVVSYNRHNGPRSSALASLQHHDYSTTLVNNITPPTGIAHLCSSTLDQAVHNFSLDSVADQRRFRRYLRMHALIHTHERPSRLVYMCDRDGTSIAWQTQNFELYASLTTVDSKRKIQETLNKLLEAINKQKNRLFVLVSPTF